MGYKCKCGHWNPCQSGWAAAHWDIELLHFCEGCKKQNIIKSGKWLAHTKDISV